MTEEIIIDGVDVAGCDFYQIEANELYPKAQYCGSMRNTFCENEPNCYYKQLKRIEQENKELKEEIRFHNKENSILLAERNAAQIGYDEIREVRELYRSALEEINILAKNYCNACDEFKAKTYKNKNDCLYCNYGFIKNKINEVLQCE